MSSFNWPATGSSSGIPIYPNVASFPSSGNIVGQQAVDASDIGSIYEWDGAAWILTASSAGVGAGITALTGDGTAAGPGSVPLTLATVNASPGAYGTASSVPSVTVNAKGLVTASANTAIQIAESQVTNLVSDLALKAPLASPTFTGTVTAPTFSGALSGNATTATTAGTISGTITESQVTNLVSDLALKAPLASPTFTGTVTAPTFSGALSGNATTATTAGTISGTITESQVTNLVSDLALKAPLASPTFTGTVTAPTFAGALSGNATTATTAGTISGTITESQVTNLVSDLALKAPLASPTFTGTVTTPALNLSGLTASQAVVTDGSKNLASLPYATAPAASTLSEWDANKNLTANSHIDAFTTTATAAGTTTLVVGSTKQQFFTGTTTQTVTLPTTSIAQGQQYVITNNSTGIVTVQSSGANTIQAMPAGSTLRVTALVATPTTAANWNAIMEVNGLILGTTPTVQKFTSGTAQTYTTPTGVQYIRVRMVGGGGGGGGSGATATAGNASTASTASTFGSSLLTANPGAGGGANGSSTQVAGGSATVSAPAVGTGIIGGGGGVPAQAASGIGGAGGQAPYFCGGGITGQSNGGNAVTNTGGGGAGAGSGFLTNQFGVGGGSGGFVEAFVFSPQSSYTYTVGVGGSAGAAGTSGYVGGTGSAGYIEVTEYYANYAVSSTLVGVTPTRQILTSGTTYTTPAGVQYIKGTVIGAGGQGGGGANVSGPGGGGGGGGGGTSTFIINAPAATYSYVIGQGGTSGGVAANGQAGTASTFNAGTYSGGGGSGGTASTAVASAGSGGAGGTSSGGTTNSTGGGGESGVFGISAVIAGIGGTGGSSTFGGGAVGIDGGSTGAAGGAYGGGGAGGGNTNVAGGAGANGVIIIEEFYTNLAVGTQAAIPANQIMAGPTSGSAAQPTFRAMVASDRPLSVVSKTTTYAMLVTDDLILGSGSAFTVTLGAASTTPGKQITIKKTDSTLANIVTVARAGSDTIDGATSVTLNTQYEYFTLVSDGVSSWSVVAHSYPQVWTTQTMTITGSSSNPAKGTNTEHYYTRRVGDSLELSYNYYQTVAGSAGSGTYLFALPSSLVIDTSIYNATGDMNVTNVGDATALNNGINVPMQGRVYIYDTTHLAVAAGASGTAIQTVASGFNSFSNATVTITFNAKVKISGWTG